jgi:hypothetical protein
MLTLHLASSCCSFEYDWRISTRPTSLLERLENVCLIVTSFLFLQNSGMQTMLFHYFLCWVTWSAFIILQACRICIGSFSPRNVLCDSFFVWRCVLKHFISGFGFITVLIKSSSGMVCDVSLCIGWFFNIYLTQFTFRVWRVQLCTDQNHFMNCTFVLNIKSCEAYLV